MRPTAPSSRRSPLRLLLAAALAVTAPGALAACGSGSGSDPDTVEVSYKQSTDNQVRVMDTFLADVKKQFEKANPSKKVKLVPIKAPDSVARNGQSEWNQMDVKVDGMKIWVWQNGKLIHDGATLKTLRRPVTLLVEPGGGHSPVEPVPREAYLFAMETMLQQHLGGPAPELPGQRLRAYLRENLRMAGPEFAALARKPR